MVSVGSGVLPCKVVIVDPVYRVNTFKRERGGGGEQCRQHCYMYLNYMYLNNPLPFSSRMALHVCINIDITKMPCVIHFLSCHKYSMCEACDSTSLP